jgi:hypothetical protein
MTRRRVAIGIAGLCAVALVAAYCGQDTKFSAKAEHRANEHRRAIQAEIKSLGKHPWAGEYYEGDGLGVGISLALAPQAGYVFEWHGCMGVYDRNFGGVSVVDGKLRLSFTFANAREGFQGISSEFIPVSWGSRVYLIPPDDMIEFCNSVNAGREPRNNIHGLHLLRCGDEKKPVAGFPSVPDAYAQYLQERPITSEIIATGAAKLRPSVADWKFKDTPVTIKGGKDIGLRRGMELHVTSPDHELQSVQITEVKERTSEGVVTEIGEESPGPSVGLKLSTLPSWAPHPPNKEPAAKNATGH